MFGKGGVEVFGVMRRKGVVNGNVPDDSVIFFFQQTVFKVRG